MISKFTFFITGGIFGIYVAQNYNIPDIKKYIENSLSLAQTIEESFRKK